MPSRQRAQSGFTYLTVLLVVAFMGIGLAKAGQVYRTTVLRDREAELLWIGRQYRLAIEGYYKNRDMRYPRTLEDLLKDPREPSVRRYLRKRYPDPITGSDEWGLVKAPDGGIMGVYSRSAEQPVKVAGFMLADRFEGAATYADWKFVYTPGDPVRRCPCRNRIGRHSPLRPSRPVGHLQRESGCAGDALGRRPRRRGQGARVARGATAREARDGARARREWRRHWERSSPQSDWKKAWREHIPAD